MSFRDPTHTGSIDTRKQLRQCLRYLHTRVQAATSRTPRDVLFVMSETVETLLRHTLWRSPKPHPVLLARKIIDHHSAFCDGLSVRDCPPTRIANFSTFRFKHAVPGAVIFFLRFLLAKSYTLSMRSGVRSRIPSLISKPRFAETPCLALATTSTSILSLFARGSDLTSVRFPLNQKLTEGWHAEAGCCELLVTEV